MSAERRPLKTYLTKRRYTEIADALRARCDDEGILYVELDDVLAIIRDVLKFDPEDTTYREYCRERLQFWKRETGVSTYELSGNRQAYKHRHNKTDKQAADAAGTS